MKNEKKQLNKKKVCLVCSSGGHFLELYRLKLAWEHYDNVWVTFFGPDTDCLLGNEMVYKAYSPTNRNISNLFRNLLLAWRILNNERPNVVVSTGAGLCVPFFYIAKILNIKTIYIESLSRRNELSLTGKLVYPITTEFIVQWPDLAERYKRVKYRGGLL